jgi:hypothetical protein
MGGLERPQSRAGLSSGRSFRPSASRVAERLLRRSAMGARAHPSYRRRRLDGPAAAPHHLPPARRQVMGQRIEYVQNPTAIDTEAAAMRRLADDRSAPHRISRFKIRETCVASQ